MPAQMNFRVFVRDFHVNEDPRVVPCVNHRTAGNRVMQTVNPADGTSWTVLNDAAAAADNDAGLVCIVVTNPEGKTEKKVDVKFICNSSDGSGAKHHRRYVVST